MDSNFADIKFVRLVFTDTSNIVRTRVFPAHRYFGRIADAGQRVATAIFGFPCLYDAVFAGAPVGETLLTPARATFACLPHAPSHAVVLADAATPLDPRGFLRRALHGLATRTGAAAHAGFESEFCLLDAAAAAPVDRTIYAQMAAFENPTTVAVLDAIVDALESMGIPVDQFHPESAPGQFEIVTAYGDALAAVDNLIKTRIVIKEVSKKVGNYVATFAPKVYAAQAGTASHVHLSLWSLDGTKNLFLNDEDLDDAKHHATSIQDDNNDPLPKVSHLGKWFLAGVLKHLPALMAITTPTPMSFERIQPCFWSGAYQVWGIENREAPLRVSQDGAHFEIKTLDGTANPYLALGAIICAGLDGIRNKEQLPPPCQVDPGALTQEERDAAGILRLPEVLEDALEKLRENKVLAEGMGPELFENFLAVRTKEAAAIAAMNPEDVRKIMIDRY